MLFPDLASVPPRRRHQWRAYQGRLSIPVILFLLIALFIYIRTKTSSSPAIVIAPPRPHLSGSEGSPNIMDHHFKLTTVEGFFLQDDRKTEGGAFEFMKHNFGLIEQDYDTDTSYTSQQQDGTTKPTQWQRFEHKLSKLNQQQSPSSGISYRILFLGRHGQGYHNVAETYYGTDAWNCYWSTLDGTPNGSMTWADAHLTEVGIAQADAVHDFWKSQIQTQRMPTPQSYFTSPLDRAIATADHTFNRLDLSHDRPFKPLVKELLREANGVHTCDRRSTRSKISARWPSYDIEEGFSEKDELWDPVWRESTSARALRFEHALDEIFTGCDSTWISITAHSGSIASILSVVGHRPFPLPTGAVIPVLVKVEKVNGKRTEVPVDPPSRKPDCVGDPLTTRAAGMPGSIEDYATTLGIDLSGA